MTATELMEACRNHIAQASAVYQEANQAVARRLKKEGITPDEFVAYCRDREPIKTAGQ